MPSEARKAFLYFVDLRQNEKEINLKVSQKKLQFIDVATAFLTWCRSYLPIYLFSQNAAISKYQMSMRNPKSMNPYVCVVVSVINDTFRENQ